MELSIRKAGFLKRFGAGLLDFILMCVLSTAVAFCLSAILGYDAYSNDLNSAYERYEKEYGVRFGISIEEYNALSELEKDAYESASVAVEQDSDLIYIYNMVVSLSILIVTLSLLISVLLTEFVLPMFLGNGQTIGKKVFSLCLVRSDCIKISNFQLLVRCLFGKFTIELMIPVYVLIMIIFGAMGFAGILVLGALLVTQLIIYAVSVNNSLIHDLIASTAVADMPLQRIFNSSDELLEYKNKLHAERVVNSDY